MYNFNQPMSIKGPDLILHFVLSFRTSAYLIIVKNKKDNFFK